MNRMPSAIATGGPQSQVHMQQTHSSPVISSSLNPPNPLSGMPHSVHGIPMPGPHDREHSVASGSGPMPSHYFSTLGMNPGSPHPVPNMMPHGHPHQFHHPHSILSLNRLPHLISQPELRIFEMNKRLQQRSDDCDSLWWESFATDFFEDDATLTLAFLTEEGPKSYAVGRTLIPRYFRSIFESGYSELFFNLRSNHEYLHHANVTLDSESASMTMNTTRPYPATVIVEGRLTLDFAFDDLMRIRSWIFLIRSHREMILRSMLGIQDPAFLEQLSKNVTRYGMTNSTLNFFRLCVILEPMQELMSRQKAYSLTPRDCLKTTLFQKWQRMMPQEATRQPSKRRKRKGSAATTEGTNNTGRASKRKQSPIPLPPHHIAQPGDVMIVGEPTLMGGDFGDEDERLITRLENTQYEAVNSNMSMSNASFATINDSVGVMSSPLGGSGSVTGSSNHPQFRGGLMTGNPNMNQAIQLHEGSAPTNQSIYSAPMSSRSVHHHSSPMMSQPFTTLPQKASVSGTSVASRSDHYMTSVSSAAGDGGHQPSRSSSASLTDTSNGLSGFPHCGSPNLLPSRPPARFTPPSLQNGLVSLPSASQPNFLMPPEVMSSSTSMGHISVPGTPLTSPLTSSSFSMDIIDNQNVLHSAPSSLVSATIKSNNSPMLYNSVGTTYPGNQLTPESAILSSMGGMGSDGPPTSMNDGEEHKLINTNTTPSRAATESV